MALKILVVDDSKTVRAVIVKSLKLADVPLDEIHEASNGKEALDLLKDHRIDLVFADLHMPVMSGMEMVERMREERLLETMPVVIISTEGSVTRIEELRSKGISAYVRKPFTPEMIRGVVEEIMGRQDASRSKGTAKPDLL